MRDLFQFLKDYFSDKNRFAGTQILLLALLVTCRWITEFDNPNQPAFAPAVYATVAILLATFSAWILFMKKR